MSFIWLLITIFVGAFIYALFRNHWQELPNPEKLRRAAKPPSQSSAPHDSYAIGQVEARAVRLGEIVRDSLAIVQNTKSLETRISRLAVAESTMFQLSKLLDENDIKMQNDADRILLREVEKYREQYNEFYFVATQQLRTPLAVLLADGKKSYAPKNKPPPNPPEEWMGIWVNKYMFGYCPTFRELGIDIDELPPSTKATEIGPIEGDGYLNFLIDIRSCCEQEIAINARISGLYAIDKAGKHTAYFSKHGGVEAVIDQLFPLVVTTIPSVNKIAAAALIKAGLDSVDKISSASDAELLQLPSIGPKTLISIRFWIDGFVGDATNVRNDNVIKMGKGYEMAQLKLM